MDNDTFFQKLIERTPVPNDYFRGLSLPAGFALPSNLLLFHTRDFSPVPRTHGRHTLVIPLETVEYIVEGRLAVMPCGTALLIHPYEVRHVHPGSPGRSRFLLTFDLPPGQGWLPESALLEFSGTGFERFRKFTESYFRNDAAEASILLYECLCAMRRLAQPEGKRVHPTVSAVLGYVNAHLSEPFCVKDIAAKLQVSESNLRSVFRRETGISPGRFHTLQRLASAKHDLRDTDSSIAEIARGNGFSNVYVFSHFFKKETGAGPREYRARARTADSGKMSAPPETDKTLPEALGETRA